MTSHAEAPSPHFVTLDRHASSKIRQRQCTRLLQFLILNLTLPAISVAMISFLQPPAGQKLYVGTNYSFTANVGNVTSVSAHDQYGNVFSCGVSQGLANCPHVPTSAGALTITISGGLYSANRSFNVLTPSGVYPMGDKMLLGAWTGFDTTVPTFTQFVSTGLNSTQIWNSTGTAATQLQFVDFAKSAGIAAPMASMDGNYCTAADGGSPSACESTLINPLFSDSNFEVWEFDGPEIAPDSTLKAETAYIHAYDPFNRPVFAYINSSTSAGFRAFLPYVDIFGAGAYELYGAEPSREINRWEVEQEIAAIQAAGYTVGPKFHSQLQKTPILVNETVCYNGACDTPAEYMHDVFAGLCAGAQGSISYYYYPDGSGAASQPGYRGPTGAYSEVTGLLNGAPGVAEWILKGVHQPDLNVQVLSGPAKAAPLFNGVVYPSVRTAVWDWAGMRVIVAVNTASTTVIAKLSGLPGMLPPASVLEESRTISTSNGTITDSFVGFGVHIYQIPSVDRQSNGVWAAL
jgi:hypothetical protein